MIRKKCNKVANSSRPFIILECAESSKDYYHEKVNLGRLMSDILIKLQMSAVIIFKEKCTH